MPSSNSLGCLLAALALAACSKKPNNAAPVPILQASTQDTRFVSREHFLAAGEMQISGEPLAEAMGRDLTGYSRDYLPTDTYFDPSPSSTGPWVDLAGFSTGVETYEYSKQPMNNVAFESGAGTSLAYGPLQNANNLAGNAAAAALSAALQHYAQGSHAQGRFVFPAGSRPVGNAANNPLGWPGIWPVAHPFRSFDPSIHPVSSNDLGCSITSDDDPGARGALATADYECDASSLHLTDRGAQIDAVITPGTDGFAAWKFGLWIINYLQVMHDSSETAVASIADASAPQVGDANNALIGSDASGAPTAAGTYLGSSDIEGFQAQLLVAALDNAAQDWLTHLSTRDGVQLSGFASLTEAQQYNEAAPLRWFPGAVAVAESDDGSGFPKPAYSIHSADSHALDLLGMAMGYAEMVALTDSSNPLVGGVAGARTCFDGDPFDPNSLHDRALALLRVALVNLDRLHADATHGLLVDDVSMNGNQPTRGTTLSTVTATYTVLALRNSLRSLTAQLQLYSNTTPDTAYGATPLDTQPLAWPGDASVSVSARAHSLLLAHANLLLNQLTDAEGRAAAGWDVQAGVATGGWDTLDAHTAAMRGLFGAYLATGNTAYRDRAVLVYGRLQADFYNAPARLFTAVPGALTAVTYTPMRFALLQSALRDMYELVAARPGNEALAQAIQKHLARLNKLVLNGWDDRNGDNKVDWPSECVQVRDGLPRGGLQMAERTLTGEIGSLQEQLQPGQVRTITSDRDHDCVPEIDDAQLPAALANAITFQVAAP